MNKVLPIGLVALYVLLTGFCFLLLLALSGVYISTLTFILALAGWGLFCGLSVYFLGPLYLFFHGRLRQPILEEELRLKACFAEVLAAAGCRKFFQLRIVEVEGEEIFAGSHRVIAISKALLNRLTDEELKGVLAHELGHLLHGDTMISWAFVTAGGLPEMVRRLFRSVRLLIWPVIGFVLLLSLVVFLFKPMFLMPVLAAILFIILFSLLDGLFRWLRLILSRLCEYRQDAYAHSLGYGAGLREALNKMAQYGREQVNTYFILMNGTRPVVYNRIRRLERLLGLRLQDEADQ